MVLDETLPTNEQTEALPFDFRYEIAISNILLTNEELGKGAFGKVTVGQFRLDDERQLKVAIKSPLSKCIMFHIITNIA